MPAGTTERADYRGAEVLNVSYFHFPSLLLLRKEHCAPRIALEWSGSQAFKVLSLDTVRLFSQLCAEVSGPPQKRGSTSLLPPFSHSPDPPDGTFFRMLR